MLPFFLALYFIAVPPEFWSLLPRAPFLVTDIFFVATLRAQALPDDAPADSPMCEDRSVSGGSKGDPWEPALATVNEIVLDQALAPPAEVLLECCSSVFHRRYGYA